MSLLIPRSQLSHLYIDLARRWITPGLRKDLQIFLGFLQCDGAVDLLQICNDFLDFLDVLIADISGGTAHLVDDAALQPAFWEDSLDSLHHPTQAVRAEQIYIFQYFSCTTDNISAIL